MRVHYFYPMKSQDWSFLWKREDILRLHEVDSPGVKLDGDEGHFKLTGLHLEIWYCEN